MLRFSFVRSVLPALCLVGIVASGVSAQVEPIIPSDVYRMKAQPTEANLKSIREYCAFWVDQMALAGDDHDVANARRKLVEPLKNATATAVFKAQYAPLCATTLQGKGLHRHEKMTVRMNTLIVAGRLPDGLGIDLAAGRLKDEQFAVRYWAAAALAQITTNKLPTDKVADVIDAVAGVVNAEPESLIRSQMYAALNNISNAAVYDDNQQITRAIALQIAALESWVERYAKSGLTEHIDAETRALPRLHGNIIFMWIKDEDAMRKPVKDYARMTGKYAQLAARLLTPHSDERVQVIGFNLVDHCQQAMVYAVRKFDPAGWPETRKAPDMVAALTKSDFLMFEDAVYQWVGRESDGLDGLLTTEKIGLPRASLMLNVTATPPAPPEPQPETEPEADPAEN